MAINLSDIIIPIWLTQLAPWLGIALGFTGIYRLLQQQQQQLARLARQTDNLPIFMATSESQQKSLQQTITQQHQQQLIHQQQEIRAAMQEIRQQITHTLQHQTTHLTQQLQNLTQQTDKHLHNITHRVHQRLDEGFAKTNSIFTDVIKRLALIDQAQQRITDLSSNVIDLQDILSNKQARGHFGEIQLQQLIGNCLPQSCYALQYTLSNNKRVDCALFLPEPTGTIAIDAKFPLENYRRMQSDPSNNKHQQGFRQDIKTHIDDIANKYIIHKETAQAAILFIPAESIFAEIHAHHHGLIAHAYQRKVWLVSPTTMMAIIHTIQALLKDIETQKQVHIIQEHLNHLATDFHRFQDRMQSVAKHIADAHEKVGKVQISAKKIHQRFQKIEKVELETNTSLSIEAVED